VWQALHEELRDRKLAVIAVALDSGGAATTAQWIRAAAPTYPCLIDERHLVGELYGMVNVPSAVWIDEEGRIVRPAETAGSTDSFRHHLDRETRRMSAEGVAERERARAAYLGAVRDWVMRGPASPFALSAEEVRRRLAGADDDQALAAVHFRLGQHLHAAGDREAAARYLAEARRLYPASWSYRRQTWEMEQPGKASGPEFWASVDALGDRPYYPPPRL
jgi:hypothetical protein